MQQTSLRLKVATNLTDRIAQLPRKSVVRQALASRANVLLSECIEDIGSLLGKPGEIRFRQNVSK